MKILMVFSVLFAAFMVLGSVFAEEVDLGSVEKESWSPSGDLKWIELRQKWRELLGPPPPVQISGSSPFAACTADDPFSRIGELFHDSEVEPWVVVNPRYPNNVVAAWQQDRWSSGGARDLVAGRY